MSLGERLLKTFVLDTCNVAHHYE